jgi:hypothetical protein
LQVELRGADRGAVGRHGAFQLAHGGALGVQRLARDRILRGQRLIALEVQPGRGELRQILGQRALRLRQAELVGARVDLGDHLPFVHHLPFLERQRETVPESWVWTVADRSA